MVRRAVRVWLVLALSLVSGHRAVAGKAVSKKATLCSQAIDCASCVQHQECYELPKPNKTTVCWPCGWCVEKGAWGADQAGTCARITDPSEDFCVADDSAPIDEDAYCSPSVCNVTTLSAPTLGKPSACACDYNVCPSVNLFLRLLRLEGFWVLVGLVHPAPRAPQPHLPATHAPRSMRRRARRAAHAPRRRAACPHDGWRGLGVQHPRVAARAAPRAGARAAARLLAGRRGTGRRRRGRGRGRGRRGGGGGGSGGGRGGRGGRGCGRGRGSRGEAREEGSGARGARCGRGRGPGFRLPAPDVRVPGAHKEFVRSHHVLGSAQRAPERSAPPLFLYMCTPHAPRSRAARCPTSRVPDLPPPLPY